MNEYTIVSLSTYNAEIARLHVAGCKDIAKDSRGHGDVVETVKAANAKEAVVKYLAVDLAEMGYLPSDVKIISCAR